MRKRFRRLRMTAPLRRLVCETHLHASQLVQPLFVAEDLEQPRPVASMPGIAQLPLEHAVREAQELEQLGVGGIILFGIPRAKDERATSAWNENGIVQQAVRAIREATSQLVIITDVCLCEYTSHGHCGILQGERILNDATVEVLARVAVSHARAGADIVAPSDMMDGRVAAIREALDSEGFAEVPILAYSAKFASAFYGPFRDAAQSTPAFGDRKSHQLPPTNFREAIRDALTDIEEGADMLMVKPALPYLDVLRELRIRTEMPLAAFQVSGEYAMLKAAALEGWLEESRAVWESLIAIRRAGADVILTYYAKEIASGKLHYEF
ncbi:MAG: porphobilinogen synthase [Candidatus Sumerlaea chitinivorans]|nr:porphobilinogen synthase [Candidatus Sumerlaea chitinivorans]